MRPNRLHGFEEQYRLPKPPDPAIAPGSFLWYPIDQLHPAPDDFRRLQLWIYQRAFEQAQSVVRPSILERDLLGVWN